MAIAAGAPARQGANPAARAACRPNRSADLTARRSGEADERLLRRASPPSLPGGARSEPGGRTGHRANCRPANPSPSRLPASPALPRRRREDDPVADPDQVRVDDLRVERSDRRIGDAERVRDLVQGVVAPDRVEVAVDPVGTRIEKRQEAARRGRRGHDSDRVADGVAAVASSVGTGVGATETAGGAPDDPDPMPADGSADRPSALGVGEAPSIPAPGRSIPPRTTTKPPATAVDAIRIPSATAVGRPGRRLARPAGPAPAMPATGLCTYRGQ